MKRTAVTALFWLLLTGATAAGPAGATAPAESNVQVLKLAIAHDPCPDGSARPTTGACAAVAAEPLAPAAATTGGCPGGLPLTSEGVCPDQPDTTAGFSLLKTSTGPTARPQATAHAQAPRVHRVRPPEAQALDNIRVEFHAGSADLTPEGEARALEVAAALKDPQYSSRRF